MRHSKEARIRIHGDEAEGAKFVSLARTLLGSLIQRDTNIGGLEQSAHKASVPGADIRVSFNSFMPVIDIWVGGEKELKLRGLQFNVIGTRRLNSLQEDVNQSAYEYTETYLTTPFQGGLYLGPYAAMLSQVGVLPEQMVSGIYPPCQVGLPPDSASPCKNPTAYFWNDSQNTIFLFESTPFTPPEESVVATPIYTRTRTPSFIAQYYKAPAKIDPLRTDANGDKIILIGLTTIINNYNTDPAGIDQPVPYVVTFNITQQTTGDIIALPMVALEKTNPPGLCYITPTVVSVGNAAFYAVCVSHPGYAVENDVSLQDAVAELLLLYTADNGTTFFRWDLRPLLADYFFLGWSDSLEMFVDSSEESYGKPSSRFNGRFSYALQLMGVYGEFLAIGNNEALYAATVTREVLADGYTYEGFTMPVGTLVYTCFILRCTPTGVSVVFSSEGWRATFPYPDPLPFPVTENMDIIISGNFQIVIFRFDRLQSWVYMGNDVILAKFISSFSGTDRKVKYMQSFDRGNTWVETAALGIPGNRLNQYYGNFCLANPYINDDNKGEVLTTVYHNNAYRSYASFDAGDNWIEVGTVSPSEQFYRVDSILIDDGGGSFDTINYYGAATNPAPYNPAIPELMRPPQ